MRRVRRFAYLLFAILLLLFLFFVIHTYLHIYMWWWLNIVFVWNWKWNENTMPSMLLSLDLNRSSDFVEFRLQKYRPVIWSNQASIQMFDIYINTIWTFKNKTGELGERRAERERERENRWDRRASMEFIDKTLFACSRDTDVHLCGETSQTQLSTTPTTINYEVCSHWTHTNNLLQQ